MSLSNFSILIVSLLCVVGCGKTDPSIDPIPRQDIELNESQRQVLAQGNDFSIKLFQEMAAANANKNFLISPLSASQVLAALSCGASGETLTQMKDALGFTSFDAAQMNSFYKTLIPALLKVDNTTKLSLANALWLRKDYAIEDAFVKEVSDNYYSTAQRLDFSDANAVKTINQWCADNTNNLITKIIDKTSQNDVLFATNALYFKGIWTNAFKKANTVTGNFTCADGSSSKASYMCQTESFSYMQDKEVSMAVFPYGNEAFRMMVILPNTGVSAYTIATTLTKERWDSWLHNLGAQQLDVRLPRFKVEFDSEEQLIPVMQQLGMKLAFSRSADFTRINPMGGLYLGLLKQKTYIEVNEEGTEAAAVTIGGMRVTSVGPKQEIPFYVNRPFIYAIQEVSTGTILFMGINASV